MTMTKKEKSKPSEQKKLGKSVEVSLPWKTPETKAEKKKYYEEIKEFREDTGKTFTTKHNMKEVKKLEHNIHPGHFPTDYKHYSKDYRSSNYLKGGFDKTNKTTVVDRNGKSHFTIDNKNGDGAHFTYPGKGGIKHTGLTNPNLESDMKKDGAKKIDIGSAKKIQADYNKSVANRSKLYAEVNAQLPWSNVAKKNEVEYGKNVTVASQVQLPKGGKK